MSRRTRFIFISVLLILLITAGCTSQSISTTVVSSNTTGSGSSTQATAKETSLMNATGFPIVNKPVTLKVFAIQSPFTQGKWGEVEVWKKYETKSGVHIEWNAVTSDVAAEKKSIAIASGDLPDAFFKVNFTVDEIIKYSEQGIFVPVTKYLDKNAPNLAQRLNKAPEIKKGITLLNGEIYGFPYVVDVATSRMTLPLINMKFLKKLNLSVPVTTDEFHSVLKSFINNDPNGNGKKDEIPLSGELGISGIINMLKGSWGLGNRGSTHVNVDIDESSGKLRFIPTDTRYKELLQYLNKLYAEKLLDQEVFAASYPGFTAKCDEDIVGCAFSVSHNMVGTKNLNDFEGFSTALKGPYNDQLYSQCSSPLSTMTGFILTSANKYPEVSVRWVDYFYSEEGMKAFFLGEDGVTYTQDSKGVCTLTDYAAKNPDGKSRNDVLAKYVGYPGGTNPSWCTDNIFGALLNRLSVQAGSNLLKSVPKEIWPAFLYNSADATRLNTLRADIEAYIKDRQAKFITGEMSFSKWDDYCAEFSKMNLKEYMEIYQRGYEHYKKS